MSVPNYLNDGNYNIARQVGCDEWSTPFSTVGDQKTFELRRTMRIAEPFYKRSRDMQRITTRKGIAYLVEESETSNIGLGILEYTLTYANVPKTRVEYTSVAYGRQFLITSGEEPSVVEIVQTRPVRVYYEYALKPLDPILAPTVEIVDGVAIAIAGWGRFVAGKLYPAEDSIVGFYKSRIFFRRTIYIKWVTGAVIDLTA